jgi:glycosyltransferase involved in cell wall biosynthesis
MKVCFLAGTLGRGGAERQLVYMLRALQSVGVTTRVLCLGQGESFEREILDLGIPVEYVGRSRNKIVRLIRIIRALRQDPPDIFQSAHFYTNLYVALAARLLRIRHLGAIRSDVANEIKANGFMGWGQLHVPAYLIANSMLARQRAIERGVSPQRVKFVRNAIDTACFTPTDRAASDRTLRLLFVGRLTQVKRPDRFLRVVSAVTKALPEYSIQALCVGGGPLRADLELLALQLGIDRQLQFLGEQDAVQRAYHQADVLVSTSDWEGTPNVILEGMACGLPVVATKVGGTPEILSSDRGFVVEPEAEDKFIEAILILACDAVLRVRLGQAGRTYVTQFHSLDVLPGTLLAIYKSL